MNSLPEKPECVFNLAKLCSASVASVISNGHRAKDFESFFFKDFYDFMDKIKLAPHNRSIIELTLPSVAYHS